jgi:polyphosphate kinase
MDMSGSGTKPVSEAEVTERRVPDWTGPGRFFNRELSWLHFNQRVLEEAANPRHPLLERLRFLSLSGADLDEFFMVRVAGLRGQVRAGIETPSQDGSTPRQQLAQISERVLALTAQQSRLWLKLQAELADDGIQVLGEHDLDAADRACLEQQFDTNVYPVLTPIAVDPAHPFPFIPSAGITLGLDLVRLDDPSRRMHAMLPIPRQLSRFMRLPSPLPVQGATDDIRFVQLETVLALFIDRLFPGHAARAKGVFRVLRDSGVELEEEAEDLVCSCETALKRRRRGEVVRLEIEQSMPAELRHFVVEGLRVGERELSLQDGPIGLADIAQLIAGDRPELQFSPFSPRYPERVRAHHGDVFAAIREQDLVVHHPYESFDVVLSLLRQAAADPDVLSIKWTLHRTSGNSPLIAALKEAAESGKSVTAIIEREARCDEEVNVCWARDLERAGVQVLCGLIELKTHAKLGQIVRREPGGLMTYVQIGTGNYHPITARVHADLSLLSADPATARDTCCIFNYLTSHAEPRGLELMSISPGGIRDRILDHIREEMYHARAGRPAEIWLQMNALIDDRVIDALYAASQAGVMIDLVVRGICCLRPGIEGLSENIRVKSVIGRFLEHARIYCFGAGHGLPSERAVIYLSSADMTPRDLDRRVEAMVPIDDPRAHNRVQDQILAANLADNEQSWHILADGSSRRFALAEDAVPFNAQQYFLDNPCLSGRGRGLEVHRPPSLPDKSR